MRSETIIKRLGNLAELKKVHKNSSAYKLVLRVCETGHNVIRPCWTSGTGRFCKNLDYTDDVCNLLDALRVGYETGNDAPRGGLYGNFLIIRNLKK